MFWVGISVFIHFPTDCTIMRVASDLPSAEYPAIWGVAMKACSNNSLSMFGSFSQQSRITDDIFFCFNARFNASVFIISPRAVLMMRGVFSRALKKSVCQRGVKCDDVGLPTNFFERNKIGFAFDFLPGGIVKQNLHSQ